MPPIITPLRDRVLIKVDPPATESAGIVIPEAAAQRLMFARVIAVGDGHLTKSGNIVSLEVSVGDHVIFQPGAGTPVRLDGVDYLMLHERLIMARVG